jgi:cell division protein FtsL
MGFVRKVFLIVLAQLAVTAGLCAISITNVDYLIYQVKKNIIIMNKKNKIRIKKLFFGIKELNKFILTFLKK